MSYLSTIATCSRFYGDEIKGIIRFKVEKILEIDSKRLAQTLARLQEGRLKNPDVPAAGVLASYLLLSADRRKAALVEINAYDHTLTLWRYKQEHGERYIGDDNGGIHCIGVFRYCPEFFDLVGLQRPKIEKPDPESYVNAHTK